MKIVKIKNNNTDKIYEAYYDEKRELIFPVSYTFEFIKLLNHEIISIEDICDECKGE